MKRIVITGPESSGKTTLAKELASYLPAIYVPEYGRLYLEWKGTDYTITDIVSIGIGQLALAEAAAETNPLQDLMVIDTWMLELKVWSQYVFGVTPEILEEMYKHHPPDLYLLCSPDLAWQPDPVRENPTDRHVLYAMYEKEVKESGIPYHIVKGSGELRFQVAIDYIREHLFP